MSKKHKDGLEELYDEKYEELTREEFNEALEEEKSSPQKKKNKKKKRWSIRLVAFILAGMLIFQMAAMLFETFTVDAMRFLQTSYRLSQDDSVQEWKESVVTVQAEGPEGSSKGTGFVIDEDGYILTNHHVIEDTKTIGVNFGGGDVLEGKLQKSDKEKDLALIQIEREELKPLHFSEETPQAEEHIYVIGNPLSFTKIANEGRTLTAEQTEEDALGISAPIYRGNSGSPVLNENGETVGVVYAKKTTSSSEQTTIGMAVPLSEIKSFLQEENR
ncbi:S1C family serine protease [Alteribacillus sp. HJP-4]|uniref:S1C family serine protease n=1 Tax=Alteribacillus sp. HJP-4 TaxID=2775394 RepID=UPI0035CCCDED